MHAYRQFVQQQMDERKWQQADLSRHSGLSTAVISRILTDKRERLIQLPEDKTIEGLAAAFGGRDMERRLWLSVARAMRLPVDEEVEVTNPRALSVEQLLGEIGRRLSGETGQPATSASGTVTQMPDRPTAKKAARQTEKPGAAGARRRQQDADAEAGDSRSPSDGV